MNTGNNNALKVTMKICLLIFYKNYYGKEILFFK